MYVEVCCSGLHFVYIVHILRMSTWRDATPNGDSMCSAACCSVLQCVAECCSVLQSVAVCCIVLQCVAVR